jgi:hypothetical protein
MKPMDTNSPSTERTGMARPPVYRSYLLRFWEERGDEPAPPVWRFSLEDPQTTRRQGFASLSALTDWLQAEMDGLDPSRPAAAEAG